VLDKVWKCPICEWVQLDGDINTISTGNTFSTVSEFTEYNTYRTEIDTHITECMLNTFGYDLFKEEHIITPEEWLTLPKPRKPVNKQRMYDNLAILYNFFGHERNWIKESESK